MLRNRLPKVRGEGGAGRASCRDRTPGVRQMLGRRHFAPAAPSAQHPTAAPVVHPPPIAPQEEVDVAVRHALQEAARRSEGSFRGRTDVAHTLGPEDSSLSANDSVRDGMTFRQVRRSGEGQAGMG